MGTTFKFLLDPTDGPLVAEMENGPVQEVIDGRGHNLPDHCHQADGEKDPTDNRGDQKFHFTIGRLR